MDQVYLVPFFDPSRCIEKDGVSKGTYFSQLPNELFGEIIKYIDHERDYINFIDLINSRITNDNYTTFKSGPITTFVKFSEDYVTDRWTSCYLIPDNDEIKIIINIPNKCYDVNKIEWICRPDIYYFNYTSYSSKIFFFRGILDRYRSKF